MTEIIDDFQRYISLGVKDEKAESELNKKLHRINLSVLEDSYPMRIFERFYTEINAYYAQTGIQNYFLCLYKIKHKTTYGGGRRISHTFPTQQEKTHSCIYYRYTNHILDDDAIVIKIIEDLNSTEKKLILFMRGVIYKDSYGHTSITEETLFNNIDYIAELLKIRTPTFNLTGFRVSPKEEEKHND